MENEVTEPAPEYHTAYTSKSNSENNRKLKNTL